MSNDYEEYDNGWDARAASMRQQGVDPWNQSNTEQEPTSAAPEINNSYYTPPSIEPIPQQNTTAVKPMDKWTIIGATILVLIILIFIIQLIRLIFSDGYKNRKRRSCDCRARCNTCNRSPCECNASIEQLMAEDGAAVGAQNFMKRCGPDPAFIRDIYGRRTMQSEDALFADTHGHGVLATFDADDSSKY